MSRDSISCDRISRSRMPKRLSERRWRECRIILGTVVDRGVADAAGRKRIRVAAWQITGRTGRFPLARACAAESCLTRMEGRSIAARAFPDRLDRERCAALFTNDP